MCIHWNVFWTLGSARSAKRSVDMKVERQLHDMQMTGRIAEV